MSTFLKITGMVVTAAVGAVAIFVLGSTLPIENGYTFRVVESGSMSPTIKAGSVVTTIPRDDYEVDDIVTFVGRERSSIPTTHRIVDTINRADQEMFVTKGDANEDVDHRTITEEEILGEVFLNVPYAGYLVRFVQTTTGFMLLVVIPLILLTISEVFVMSKQIKRTKNGDIDSDGGGDD
ncbi:MAG: signal peptidase I [Candidatus Campbellbacteria bacterium]|nr:signal peptidase I [Candidatus Campbellbacteria bacterium]